MERLDPEPLKQHQWTRLMVLARAALLANRFLGARCARAELADPRDLRDRARAPRGAHDGGRGGARRGHSRGAGIEAAWGARAYDHAGMTEMGAYGFECAAQARLHGNEAEFIAEVVDPATGRPAAKGELVLSNLGRVGSPLLRYRTGDRGRVARPPCACGRTFLRLDGGILGRVDDMLIVRGVNVFPSALEASCAASPRSTSS